MVNGHARMLATATIKGFIVAVVDSISYILSLSWWMILIVVALPILLLSLLAVPGTVIGIICNMGLESSFWRVLALVALLALALVPIYYLLLAILGIDVLEQERLQILHAKEASMATLEVFE